MSTRRDNVPFDPYHYEKQAGAGQRLSVQETFRQIYQTAHWNGPASVSGAGADLTQTQLLREALPALLRELEIGALLDAPCGDFGWMQNAPLPVGQYTGADIVPELIAGHQEKYGAPNRNFLVLDLTTDKLPAADMLLCRDCLVHLSLADCRRALVNLKNSGIPWFLTTTFPECETNEDIVTGDWRLLNLQRPPFRFPDPIRTLNEGCTEGNGLFQDKTLALWMTEQIP
ncbi:MAG: class I SAM-dependent methyltransferase [Blastocatellia bacterium]